MAAKVARPERRSLSTEPATALPAPSSADNPPKIIVLGMIMEQADELQVVGRSFVRYAMAKELQKDRPQQSWVTPVQCTLGHVFLANCAGGG